MPDKQNKKVGLLNGAYKTEYSKEGFATYKCGVFHNGIMITTGNRKEMRKHIAKMDSHYNM